MPTAYVLINCELGADESIIEKLQKVEDVKEVFGIFGTYDIMVKIQADNPIALRESITWNVQKIDKIRSTSTLMKK